MSLIESISIPLAANDLMADSLPDPMPFTKTLTLSMPSFFALSTIVSATLEEAKGVAFLAPLKPIAPEEAQVKTFPLESVILIIVLL